MGGRVKGYNLAFLAEVFELRIKYKDWVIDIKPLKMGVLILHSIPVMVFTHLLGHVLLLFGCELRGQAGEIEWRLGNQFPFGSIGLYPTDCAMNKRKSGLTQSSVFEELSDTHRILLQLQGLAQWLM